MDSFLNSLKYDLTPKNLTENGAIQFQTTKSANLDWFGIGSSMRNENIELVIELFEKAYRENKQLALRNLFYTRDIRLGQGERKIFRTILKFLANHFPNDLKQVLELIPLYGRYDDYKALLHTNLEEDMLAILKKQFYADLNHETPSLLAKWLPSKPRRSTSKNWDWYNKVLKSFHMNQEHYRKALGILRAKLDVVERKITANRWDEIEFSKIPSQALNRYTALFRKHCRYRFIDYLDQVRRGEEKINTSTIVPYQIVESILNDRKNISSEGIKTYDILWKKLPSLTNKSNTLCVVDTSGSMFTQRSPRPIDISISLGIYFAEQIKGYFHNCMISFSAKPQLVILNGNNIYENVNYVMKECEGYNTDMQKVFDLILNTAIKNNLSKDDLPERILLISDMQFDQAVNLSSSDPIFLSIRNQFKNHGYDLPEIVFWNVAGRNIGFPEICGHVKLISGFNPSIFNMIIGCEAEFGPFEFMLRVLNSPRYNCILINES